VTDYSVPPLPTALDPAPSYFGLGRNAPGEYSRAMLWIENRNKRLALGARLEALLASDQISAANIVASTAPLMDAVHERQLPDIEPDEDEWGAPPITNWGANS
jgi:hypothetical protein